MERYKLQIKPSASKELDLVGPKKDRQRIVTRINSLAAVPRPSGCDKLEAEKTDIECGKETIESSIRLMISDDWSSLPKSVIAGRFTDSSE